MLNRARGMLSSAASLVTTATEGEEDSLDNMPENLQYENFGSDKIRW